jgi:hypothetical protein
LSRSGKGRGGQGDSPPQQRNFICIEPMPAISNALNMAHRGQYTELQTIAPRGTWRESFWVRAGGFAAARRIVRVDFKIDCEFVARIEVLGVRLVSNDSSVLRAFPKIASPLGRPS